LHIKLFLTNLTKCDFNNLDIKYDYVRLCTVIKYTKYHTLITRQSIFVLEYMFYFSGINNYNAEKAR